MSLFTQRAEQRTANLFGQDYLTARIRDAAGDRRVSMTVTPDTAMGSSAVAACVLTICNLSILEVHSEVTRDGMPQRSPSTPKVLTAPSAEITAMQWRRQVFDAWCRRGTAFGMVAASDGNGYPTQIELVPADCITLRAERTSAVVRWAWKIDGQPVERWPYGPLWVAPGLHTVTGSPLGVSPIELALDAIKLGLMAEDFGSSWFADGATPASILYSDQVLEEPTAKAIKARFLEAVKGKREPAVLGAGLKWQQVSVAPNESQFIETLDRNVATVARFFLMPPEEIGGTSGNSMTYGNVESRQLAKLLTTLQPWIAHFEDTMSAITPRPQTPRCDVTGLLRTDIKTRTDVDSADVAAGIRTRDEVRQTRGLPPLPGGAGAAPPPFKSPDATLTRSDVAELVAAAEQPITVNVSPAAVNVDARTDIAPTTVTVEPAESHIDARTEVHPAEVNVTPAAVTVNTPDVRVDARTTVDPVTVTVEPTTTHVDARTQVDVPAPKPTKRTVRRDVHGQIAEIEES